MDLKLYKFNLQKSLEDPRDFMLENIYPEAVSLPSVWDLRKQMKPVRDQGTEGTCSAQTAAAMKEWQERADVGFTEYMSPWFIYQLRYNQGESGMTPRDTMEILYKVGIVPESDFKYLTSAVVTKELKEKAGNFRIQGYAKINTIDSLKKALFANGPCYIAFPVYDPHEPEFWKPKYVGQTSLGGHAVCVTGYLKNSFIIRNSWSSRWGEGGYSYYPFEHFGMHWEIWTAIDSSSSVDGINNKSVEYSCSKSLFRKIFGSKIKK